MKMLRLAALALALIVMGGEALRSWGERDLVWWIDDFLVGAALIAGAFIAGKPTPARRAAFTGAWGFSAGVIYISFFDKVIAPAASGANIEVNRLNLFVAATLLAAIAGFAASIAAPFDTSH